MFTKEDMREYCADILAMESRMETTYAALAVQLSHPQYRRLFEQLMREEQDHSFRASRLMALLTDETT